MTTIHVFVKHQIFGVFGAFLWYKGDMHITLKQLELWTHIGITPEERANEQCILVDLHLKVDDSTAHQTDTVADTADYQKIYDAIKMLTKTERNTLEKFAEDIAQAVLKFDHVISTTVTLKKFVLPGVDHVSLTITRL